MNTIASIDNQICKIVNCLLDKLIVSRLPSKTLLWSRFVEEMVAPLMGGDTAIDIGCGTGSNLPLNQGWIGIDVYAPALHQAPRYLYRDLICGDLKVLDSFIKPKSADVVVAFDVVEHFAKDASVQLIQKMESVARKRVIILTPNGFIKQDSLVVAENPWMEHQCGWMPDEFLQMGYNVVGYSGWKGFAGRDNYIRHRLNGLFQILMTVSQPVVRDRPNSAFHLFCWKDLADSCENATS